MRNGKMSESTGGKEHFTPPDGFIKWYTDVGNSWSYSGVTDGVQTSPRPVQFLLTLQEE